MIAVLNVALAASAALGSTPPSVKVSLSSSSTFFRGDNAQVHVQTARDGYLVVLRSDANGHVRVLFPLDPGAPNAVRADKKIEIKGRGDRDAFAVDERAGSGVVVAAWSPTQFNFDSLSRGGHWDLTALDSMQLSGDKEAGLVDIVQQMAGDNHFDYDAAPYTVISPRAYYRGVPLVGPCWGCVGFVTGPYPVWVRSVRLGIGYFPFGGRFGWGWPR